jgi:hypothetical protein
MARTQGFPPVENFCLLSESYQSDLLPKKYYRIEETELLRHRLPLLSSNRFPKTLPSQVPLFRFGPPQRQSSETR